MSCYCSLQPLTNIGIQQARAAHQTIGQKKYWRCYVSNQERAFRTAYYILYNKTSPSHVRQTHKENNGNSDEVIYYNNNNEQTNRVDNECSLILEPRLRERAKGVREGRNKNLSYEEALALFEKEQGGRMPVLETEQDVWERINDWIMDVWKDACHDYESNCRQNDSMSETDAAIYDVLAVSHSGTLRTAIENLVYSQLPPNLEREPGSQVGRMLVPNTSLTTIELDFKSPDTKYWNKENIDQWEVKLLEFVNVSHLNGVKLERQKLEVSKV